jgi:hypothetical protein
MSQDNDKILYKDKNKQILSLLTYVNANYSTLTIEQKQQYLKEIDSKLAIYNTNNLSTDICGCKYKKC